MVSEKEIEAYLRIRIKKLGGVAYKFTSPGNDGVPDRLVLLPDGDVSFVELKAPGKKPSKLQTVQINRIKKLGFDVHVIDSKELVDEIYPLIDDIDKMYPLEGDKVEI